MTVPIEADVNERLLVALAIARKGGTSAYVIAAKAGVHPSRLSRWAYGHGNPTLEQAEKVSSALGETVNRLFPGLTDSRPADRPGANATEATADGVDAS